MRIGRVAPVGILLLFAWGLSFAQRADRSPASSPAPFMRSAEAFAPVRSPADDSEPDLGPLNAIEVDEVNIDAAERSLLYSDLQTLRGMQLDVEVGSHFDRLFGGRTVSDVQRYLVDRIHYIGQDLDDRPRDRASTYAYNYGPSWLDYFYKTRILNQAHAKPDTGKFKDRTIAITSPRTGLVVLGGMYSTEATLIDRIETLVHEGRHSDCPHAPSRPDIVAFEHSRYDQMTVEGKSCTNIHTPCPHGHALAGELACDSHPWGGYMVGWAFADSIYKSCRNCTEREKQEALATASEDLTRLSPDLKSAIQDGTLPEPDMSSIQ